VSSSCATSFLLRSDTPTNRKPRLATSVDETESVGRLKGMILAPGGEPVGAASAGKDVNCRSRRLPAARQSPLESYFWIFAAKSRSARARSRYCLGVRYEPSWPFSILMALSSWLAARFSAVAAIWVTGFGFTTFELLATEIAASIAPVSAAELIASSSNSEGVQANGAAIRWGSRLRGLRATRRAQH